MKNYLNLLLLLLSLIMCPTLASSRHNIKEIPKKSSLSMRQIADLCLPSVVLITIRGQDGKVIASGSGFVVGNHLIATNVHVVDDAHEVTVNFSDGRSVEALGIVNGNSSTDLAILYADTGSTALLPMAMLPAHIGDAVVALGSPEGLSGSMSTGIISGIRTISGVKVLQTTAPISHGSSGGPLLNDSGEILGVTSFMLRDGQNLNFAYPSYYLKTLIPSQIIRYLSWDDKGWVQVDTTLGLNLVYDALQYLPRGKHSKDPVRFDASGFVKIIFNFNGIKLPASAEAQAGVGYDVPRSDWSQWNAGDRVYFAFHHPHIDHTGIYLGESLFVHVSANQDHKVIVDKIDDSYYAGHLVCVRRSRELLGEPTQMRSSRH